MSFTIVVKPNVKNTEKKKIKMITPSFSTFDGYPKDSSIFLLGKMFNQSPIEFYDISYHRFLDFTGLRLLVQKSEETQAELERLLTSLGFVKGENDPPSTDEIYSKRYGLGARTLFNLYVQLVDNLERDKFVMEKVIASGLIRQPAFTTVSTALETGRLLVFTKQ
jgi:hypothetical protein